MGIVVTLRGWIKGREALIDFAYRFEKQDFVRRFATVDLLIDFRDWIRHYRFTYRFPRLDSPLKIYLIDYATLGVDLGAFPQIL